MNDTQVNTMVDIDEEEHRENPVQTGERFAEGFVTGAFYRVTKWEDHGDGHIVAINKEEVSKEEIPDERLCDYCEDSLAVEWSDQGKRQCAGCSPCQESR